MLQGTQPVRETARTETHSYRPLLSVHHPSLPSKSLPAMETAWPPQTPGPETSYGILRNGPHLSPASQPAPPPWPPLGLLTDRNQPRNRHTECRAQAQHWSGQGLAGRGEPGGSSRSLLTRSCSSGPSFLLCKRGSKRPPSPRALRRLHRL